MLSVSAGVWNAHTSVGNILGSAVAAACLSWGWGWAFLIPGATLAFAGLIVWLFLVVEPEEAGLLKMKDSLVVTSSLISKFLRETTAFQTHRIPCIRTTCSTYQLFDKALAINLFLALTSALISHGGLISA